MHNADRGDKQCGNHNAQGGGLHTVVGTGLLPKKNVQRPADTCPQCVTGPQQINALRRCARRYQQQQADSGQGDPQEVDGAA
ncbi:hypothetical protein D3C81_1672030 [compost metagenome]